MTNQSINRVIFARPWFGPFAAIVAWLPLASFASTYFVATNGVDNNPGTLAQPLQHIQKAATNAVAGDAVFIRGGSYRETVTPLNSGNGSAPIVFQSYSNEVVTISGADIITNSWANYSGNVYSNGMGWDFGSGNQVFLDGQMMIEARYPNTTMDVSHPVKLVATAGTYTGTSGMQTGTVFNASLTKPTNYWMGGTINITIGKVWNSQTCPIIGSGIGQVTFTFSPTSTNYLPNAGNPFFLFGKLSELDAPGEWYFTNNLLYLWPPQSDSPASHLIEAKHRALGFDLSGNSWITVSNINFFACAVATSPRTRNCVLNQLNLTYPVHTDQMGVFTQGTNAGVSLLGASNVLQNSLIAYSAGSGVYVVGTNNVVTNNLIHDVDYSGNNGAGICTDAGYRVFGGTNTVIAGNTIYNTGGCPMDIGGLVAGYVNHNDLSFGGLQITDFGAIYAYTTVGQGTRIAYNLCHDVDAPSNNSGITNNDSKGIYLDGGSTGFVVDHNVIWNALTGIVLNSGNITNSAHLLLNNTVLGDAGSVGWNTTPELGTVFQNNIFRTNAAFGSGSVSTNNLFSSTDPKFVTASSHNYQLQSGSPAINAGIQYSPYTDGFVGTNPDQGAYEYSQTAWVAGSTVKTVPNFLYLTVSQTTNYGATNITLSGTISAIGPLYPTNGEVISISINGNAQSTTISDTTGDFSLNYNPAAIPVSATPYPISYSYPGSATFYSASNNSMTLTVNPVPLTVTASNLVKVYDGVPYSGGNGVSYSGFVNGENSNVLSGTLVYGGTSQGAVAAGTYTIIPSGITATNYSLTFSNGTLTIYAPPITNLTWDIVGGDGAAISNGSGTWDTTNTNWNNGTGNVGWSNSPVSNATFGKGTNSSAPWVTGPVVTLGSPITVGNVTFTNWNGTTNIQYQITGNTLSLSNSPIITTRSDGQITSVFAGSGFVKDGAGTLRVDGNSPNYTGSITVSNGLLQIGNNGGGGNLGLGIITLIDPGTLVVRRQGTLTLSNLITGTITNSVGFQLNGSAVITLVQANTYSANGGTYLQPTGSGTVGTLKLGINDGLPTATAFSINNNGVSVQTFDLAGFNQTLGSLATGVSGSTANSIVTNSASSSVSIMTVSGTNLTTYAGLLTGNLALAKAGAGALTLSSSNTFTGNTTVSAGTLQVSGSISNAAQVIVTNVATLQLASGKITTGAVHIYTNAFLLGCGKITGVLINDGTMVSDCGTNMTLTGAVTNNGTMRITAGTQLIASGPFVNNGLLDIINAAGSLPPGFVNNGVVLDSTSVRVLQSAITGQDFLAQILSVIGHTYQLQRSTSLSPASWSDIGTSQTGTGASLTFTNSGALAQPQGFYRFKVN